MKKISVLGLCLLTLGTASAQKQLVKEVEREMKGNAASYPESVKKLAPAFTNQETATDAFTFYVAGKGAFDYYDQQSVFAQMGKEVNKKQIGLSILEGYDYMNKALPLDTIVDAKGKVKTKYSKDIVKNVAAHYNDFNNAALYLWESEDYSNAVKAWELYTTLPSNPVYAKNIKAPADTLMAVTPSLTAIPKRMPTIMPFQLHLSCRILRQWLKSPKKHMHFTERKTLAISDI